MTVAVQETSGLMPVAEALECRLGYRPSPPTIWRWRRKGVNSARLRCRRCGRKWMTTLAYVDEFIHEQSLDQADESIQDNDEQTTRRLKAAGLLGRE